MSDEISSENFVSSKTPQKSTYTRTVLGAISQNSPSLPLNNQSSLFAEGSSLAVKSSQDPVPISLSPSGDKWSGIRDLDEAERWIDRNWVITAPEHQQNIEIAQAIVDDLLANLPLETEVKDSTEHSSDCVHSELRHSLPETDSCSHLQEHNAAASTAFTASANTSTEKQRLESTTGEDNKLDFSNTTSPLLQSSVGHPLSSVGTLVSSGTFSSESYPAVFTSPDTFNTSFNCPHSSSEVQSVDQLEALLEGLQLEDLKLSSEQESPICEPRNIEAEKSIAPVAESQEPSSAEEPIKVEKKSEEQPINAEKPAAEEAITVEKLSGEQQISAESPVAGNPIELKTGLEQVWISEDLSASEQSGDQELVKAEVSTDCPLNTTFDLSTQESAVSEDLVTEKPTSAVTSEKEDTASYLLNQTFDCSEQPVSAEEQPVSSEEQPVSAEEQPVSAEEQPVSAEEGVTEGSVGLQELSEGNSENKILVSEFAISQAYSEEPITTQKSCAEDPTSIEKPITEDTTVETTAATTNFDDIPIKPAASVLPAIMGDEADEIPIPKGTYTINWDEIDEFADPFAMSKPKTAPVGLAHSPPIRSNANPPRFDPTPEPTVSDDPPAAGREEQPPPPADPEPADPEPVLEEKMEAPKKKTPVKKKKAATSKPGGPSRFAQFKKNAQAKVQEDNGGAGDAPLPEADAPSQAAPPDQPNAPDETGDSAAPSEEPIPPPASYNFDLDNCDDPFGSKSKVPNSPTDKLPAPPTSYDFENVENPFGTKNKMANSPKEKTLPAAFDFENVENPFGTRSKMVNSPTDKAPPTTTFDEENVDNPFVTKSKMVNSPTTKEAPAEFPDEPAKESKEKKSSSPSKQKNSKSKLPNGTKSSFMTSAQMSSNQESALPDTDSSNRTETPSYQDTNSAKTNATSPSQDEDFQDAVDELPFEENFKPATAELFNTTADWGVLERGSSKSNFRESALARQSLYRKFDPLVGDSPSVQPEKLDTVTEDEPRDQSINLFGETPPSAKTSKQQRPSVRSVDKLLDITAVMPHAEEPRLQEELEQARNELQQMKLDYEAKLLAKDQEIHNIRQENTTLEGRVEGYEKTINELLNEREKSLTISEKEVSKLKEERDHYAEDLQQVERSFMELHRRFDLLRENVNTLNNNERSLVQDRDEKVQQLKDAAIKSHEMRTEFEEKLQKAHEQMNQLKSAKQTEFMQMEMAKRKAELNVASLQQQLAQKTAECEELTKICDNLIQMKQQ